MKTARAYGKDCGIVVFDDDTTVYVSRSLTVAIGSSKLDVVIAHNLNTLDKHDRSNLLYMFRHIQMCRYVSCQEFLATLASHNVSPVNVHTFTERTME